jgi:hypothetical protein
LIFSFNEEKKQEERESIPPSEIRKKEAKEEEDSITTFPHSIFISSSSYGPSDGTIKEI